MNFISRVRSRINAEGYRKTFLYGALVGVDSITTFLKDSYLDMTNSGRMLHGNKASKFKHLGSNDVYHTDYTAMPFIFQHIEIKPQDVLVDVGCGKGRVINYWLSKNYQNQILGLEIDPEIAAATARQFYRRPNVRILAGDAIENLPSEGTVFYFYNPFGADKVREFEKVLRNTAGDHTVTILYYNPKSLHFFENPVWSVRKINFDQDLGIRRWGRLNKFHDLAIITKNQH